ncbi:MAG: hypothetical protein V1800_05175, partial [Candidatus Latescibacterota bacterium]
MCSASDRIMTIGHTEYCLSGNRLRIFHKSEPVLDICLSPVLDCQKVPITAWQKMGPNQYEGALGRYGKAFLSEKFGKLAFWIETPIKSFDHVTYLSDGILSGETWRTFVSDEYERLWDKKIDTYIPISSAYADTNSPDGNTGGGMTDPDDLPPTWIWNVPVRAFALGGKASWLGVSLPGAWGIGVTRLKMHRERFSLEFEVMQTGCTGGKMPVIYFCPGLADGFDALDEHRRLSEQLGLFNLERKTYPKWWDNPWYKYWDEMERQMHGVMINKESASVIGMIRDWVKIVQD